MFSKQLNMMQKFELWIKAAIKLDSSKIGFQIIYIYPAMCEKQGQ